MDCVVRWGVVCRLYRGELTAMSTLFFWWGFMAAVCSLRVGLSEQRISKGFR